MSAVKPPNVARDVLTVCSSRPRQCETFHVLRCTTCGWWGHEPEPGQTGDLFGQDEHTDAECQRRQTDPRFRWEQDNARLVAAGLPGLAPPEPHMGTEQK